MSDQDLEAAVKSLSKADLEKIINGGGRFDSLKDIGKGKFLDKLKALPSVKHYYAFREGISAGLTDQLRRTYLTADGGESYLEKLVQRSRIVSRLDDPSTTQEDKVEQLKSEATAILDDYYSSHIVDAVARAYSKKGKCSVV